MAPIRRRASRAASLPLILDLPVARRAIAVHMIVCCVSYSFVFIYWLCLQCTCMDAWMHGCMDAWMHGCMDAWMHGCTDACADARTHGFANARMRWCTDAWTRECVDVWICMSAAGAARSRGAANHKLAAPRSGSQPSSDDSAWTALASYFVW